MYIPSEHFTEEQLRSIRMLGVSIHNNQIPLQYKDHFFIGSGQIWDIDTYTAECCLCLTMASGEYHDYRQAKMFEHNVVDYHLMNRVCCEYKIPSFNLMCKPSVSQFADTVIICEAGRGIDVLLASLAKPWARIVAYDQDKGVLHEMQKYFRGQLGLPFEVQQCNTLNYDFKGINEKAVVLGTCHNVGADKKKEILGNPNLMGIFDGEFLV